MFEITESTANLCDLTATTFLLLRYIKDHRICDITSKCRTNIIKELLEYSLTRYICCLISLRSAFYSFFANQPSPTTKSNSSQCHSFHSANLPKHITSSLPPQPSTLKHMRSNIHFHKQSPSRLSGYQIMSLEEPLKSKMREKRQIKSNPTELKVATIIKQTCAHDANTIAIKTLNSQIS
ncbi:hypothetical protein EYC80_007142 [Monilinia laxa]|uniref:Uncharacterized protein n=1 Tax=Monilinia laxa TaxID=61186 RepID=A0A5N6K0A3_MONLA|nr:hypothetical protein EYC80_007142 [Monilinia laxa]